jgi:hypothetical protein
MDKSEACAPEQITIKDAVYAFGPCAGGYAKAYDRILREIATNPEFGFKVVSGFPKTLLIDPTEPAIRDWLAKVLDQPSDNQEKVDFFKWLESPKSDLRVSFSQARAIWIPQKPETWISNAFMNPLWNECEALAWIATRDSYIVGQFQSFYKQGELNNYLGLISLLAAEKCEIKHHEKYKNQKWKTCRCLEQSWYLLKDFPKYIDYEKNYISRLEYNLNDGFITLINFDLNHELPFFSKAHLVQRFQTFENNTILEKEYSPQFFAKTGSLFLQAKSIFSQPANPVHPPQEGESTPRRPGRPPLGVEYLAEFHRRATADKPEDGLLDSLQQESYYLEKWFKSQHPDKLKHPTAKTIENAIRHKFWAAKDSNKNPRN